MKQFIYVSIITIAFTLIGCNNNNNTDTTTPEKIPSISEIANSNELIDVDIMSAAYQNVLTNGKTRANVEETNKIKAAIYRFYKHVSVVDNHYVCDIETASELNLSPQLFDDLMATLNRTNTQIDSIIAKDGEIEIAVPDSTYLQSLLK